MSRQSPTVGHCGTNTTARMLNISVASDKPYLQAPRRFLSHLSLEIATLVRPDVAATLTYVISTYCLLEQIFATRSRGKLNMENVLERTMSRNGFEGLSSQTSFIRVGRHSTTSCIY